MENIYLKTHYCKGERYRLKVIRDNTSTFHVGKLSDYTQRVWTFEM